MDRLSFSEYRIVKAVLPEEDKDKESLVEMATKTELRREAELARKSVQQHILFEKMLNKA